MANITRVYFNSASTETATLVHGSSVGLKGYHLIENGSANVFLQLFDSATAGAVTVGTTTPRMVLLIPAGGGTDLIFRDDITFNNGLVVAATATATGNGAPGSDPTVNLFLSQ